MTAVMVSTISIKNPELFREYMEKTQQVARPFGAKMLFRGQVADALAGEPVLGSMVVVAEFPDLDALQRWNRSPAYKEIVSLREESSIQVMTAYTGME